MAPTASRYTRNAPARRQSRRTSGRRRTCRPLQDGGEVGSGPRPGGRLRTLSMGEDHRHDHVRVLAPGREREVVAALGEMAEARQEPVELDPELGEIGPFDERGRATIGQRRGGIGGQVACDGGQVVQRRGRAPGRPVAPPGRRVDTDRVDAGGPELEGERAVVAVHHERNDDVGVGSSPGERRDRVDPPEQRLVVEIRRVLGPRGWPGPGPARRSRRAPSGPAGGCAARRRRRAAGAAGPRHRGGTRAPPVPWAGRGGARGCHGASRAPRRRRRWWSCRSRRDSRTNGRDPPAGRRAGRPAPRARRSRRHSRAGR